MSAAVAAAIQQAEQHVEEVSEALRKWTTRPLGPESTWLIANEQLRAMGVPIEKVITGLVPMFDEATPDQTQQICVVLTKALENSRLLVSLARALNLAAISLGAPRPGAVS